MAVSRETILGAGDLERIGIDQVFQQLKCSEEGLTSDDGAYRLQIFGPNKLELKKESVQYLALYYLVLVVGSFTVTCFIPVEGEGMLLEWPFILGIGVLILLNGIIDSNSFHKADTAVTAGLAPKTKVLRDGRWSKQDVAILVPGDVISIKPGDIVPADVRLLKGGSLQIDQPTLNGKSLPVTKNSGDMVFSCSTCKQGELKAVVIATGKAAHLVDNTNRPGHCKQLMAITYFLVWSTIVGVIVEIIVMILQERPAKGLYGNFLVLMIGMFPTALLTVLSVTVATGTHRLAQHGAIIKGMAAIVKLAGMDVLCIDKTGGLTLNKLSTDKNLIKVFAQGVDKEHVLLWAAAEASRTENHDAMVNMLEDPEEARAGIRELHFRPFNPLQILPFNPVDKVTALTYIDADGSRHRVSKGAPEQILDLCNASKEIRNKVHSVINKFAKRGLQSLAVARQEVPEKTMDGSGSLWQFVGLLPLFDPLRHDSAETISRALVLGVNVKMITGDPLPIAKEICQRLGMGTNINPSSSLLSQDKEASSAAIPVDEIIEKADGFTGVIPEHKYEIVQRLQRRKHICGMTGDGVNDVPALKKADIGIAMADATDVARGASDIVLTEPAGLSVIISAVLTCRAIFQRLRNYMIYAVSISIRAVIGFTLVALIWKFDFSPSMAVVIAILNDSTTMSTIMIIPQDRVKPSPMPVSWKLKEIFAIGIVFGSYLAFMMVIFFWAMKDTDFFTDKFGVRSLRHSEEEMMSALFLQVSIMSQSVIFVSRSRSWSFVKRPELHLAGAFMVTELIATLVAVYAHSNLVRIKGIGWGWAGIIWLYNIVSFFPLDLLKFAIRYIQSGKEPPRYELAFTMRERGHKAFVIRIVVQ